MESISDLAVAVKNLQPVAPDLQVSEPQPAAAAAALAAAVAAGPPTTRPATAAPAAGTDGTHSIVCDAAAAAGLAQELLDAAGQKVA
jgi:hypothetical protein